LAASVDATAGNFAICFVRSASAPTSGLLAPVDVIRQIGGGDVERASASGGRDPSDRCLITAASSEPDPSAATRPAVGDEHHRRFETIPSDGHALGRTTRAARSAAVGRNDIAA